jgi:hypothetical protein
MNLKALCPFALLVCLAAGPSMAQTEAMCAGLAEDATWPMDHDAVKAAPKNHKVIYESADVRVLEVTVQPGERELVHHHQWPSVMVVDQDGKEIRPAVQAPPNPEMPIMVRLPAQAAHAIDNVGDKPFHAIRIEYKKLCPAP